MTEIEIKPNDLISGSTYLKFLHDYKAYDRRQKEIIATLRNKIEFLEWEVEDLRLALEDSDGPSYTKLHTKLRNQRANLISCSSRIAQLKKDNEALIMENVSLTQQINDLKQYIHNLAGGSMASHLSDMVD